MINVLNMKLHTAQYNLPGSQVQYLRVCVFHPPVQQPCLLVFAFTIFYPTICCCPLCTKGWYTSQNMIVYWCLSWTKMLVLDYISACYCQPPLHLLHHTHLTAFKLLPNISGRKRDLFLRGRISLKNWSYCPLLRERATPFKSTCLLI
jgi:hypothetical protein